MFEDPISGTILARNVADDGALHTVRARPLIWDHLTLIVARINALISFYTQFRVCRNFSRNASRITSKRVEADLAKHDRMAAYGA